MAGDLVGGQRGGGADVQRAQPTAHGDADDQVAAFAHQARQPVALGAENQADALAPTGTPAAVDTTDADEAPLSQAADEDSEEETADEVAE